MQDGTRLSELARFLRDRRERTAPEASIATRSRRRRARGLRREEVAEAAGISTTWYIRLEQGQDVRASVHALHGIGRALRLTRPEQNYLLGLARPDLDWKGKRRASEGPSHGMRGLLHSLGPYPAYILDSRWNVAACNIAARLVFGNLDAEDRWGCNLVARLFNDPEMRKIFASWPAVARSVVSQFRLACTNDAASEAFVLDLSSTNADFANLWSARELSEPPMWQKTIKHPLVGELVFDFVALRGTGADEGCIVALHTPAEPLTKDRVARLLSFI